LFFPRLNLSPSSSQHDFLPELTTEIVFDKNLNTTKIKKEMLDQFMSKEGMLLWEEKSDHCFENPPRRALPLVIQCSQSLSGRQIVI
jgi:hypothetical protein